MARATAAVDPESQAYLPDFCAAGTIFVFVLVSELVAIVLTLAAAPAPGLFLVELAEMSLYAIWFALLASAVLCRMRGRVSRLGKAKAFVISFLLLVGLCLLLSEAAWQVTARFSETPVIKGTHLAFLLRTLAISSIVIALAMRYLYVSSEWQRSVALEALGSITGADSAVTEAIPLIDEFRFGSAYSSITGRTEPTVTIGKRLTERLRAFVTSGLSEAREVRSNVEWRLNSRWTVEGSYDNVNDISSSSLGNLGADGRWRIEFR